MNNTNTNNFGVDAYNSLCEDLMERANGRNPALRRGQALMNGLYTARRDVYDMVSGSEGDCFFDDNKEGLFWNFVFRVMRGTEGW